MLNLKELVYEPKLIWGDKNSKLLMQNGLFYQAFIFPHPKPPLTKCNLCGHKLRRKHFTCLGCRTRRAYQNKIPSILPVKPYILLIRQDIPKSRRFIIKKILSIVEFLTNW